MLLFSVSDLTCRRRCSFCPSGRTKKEGEEKKKERKKQGMMSGLATRGTGRSETLRFIRNGTVVRMA